MPSVMIAKNLIKVFPLIKKFIKEILISFMFALCFLIVTLGLWNLLIKIPWESVRLLLTNFVLIVASICIFTKIKNEKWITRMILIFLVLSAVLLVQTIILII
jgi:hypothetical protein